MIHWVIWVVVVEIKAAEKRGTNLVVFLNFSTLEHKLSKKQKYLLKDCYLSTVIIIIQVRKLFTKITVGKNQL